MLFLWGIGAEIHDIDKRSELNKILKELQLWKSHILIFFRDLVVAYIQIYSSIRLVINGTEGEEEHHHELLSKKIEKLDIDAVLTHKLTF